jgi:DNA-binding response OmpR family regulator
MGSSPPHRKEDLMKILVIEDDPLVAEVLQALLSNCHYAVDVTATSEAGLEMADAFEYDLVLMDIWLPGMDGVSACRELRDRGYKMPILLLTAQDDAQEKAHALNEGADDYMVKPFNAEELVARVQALLRRGETQAQPVLTWGPLSIDPRSFSATYGPHPLTLTPKEYGILELFLRHPQQVFSARVILDRVWNSVDSPGEEAVRVHIKELRRKFAAIGAPKNLIETLQRLGYRLNPAYETPSAIAPDEISETSPPTALGVASEALPSGAANVSESSRASAVQPFMENERQQLQARNEELTRQVAELTTALVEARGQPRPGGDERSPEHLRQLASTAIHELNNVFTQILATSQLLRLTQRDLDEAIQERLRQLEESAKRGAEQLKQLLALIYDLADSPP